MDIQTNVTGKTDIFLENEGDFTKIFLDFSGNDGIIFVLKLLPFLS